MAETDNRVCDPISRAELERRWAAVRERMKDEGFDALIVQGNNNLASSAGYFRWLTGISSFTSYSQTVIFPRDGLMTMVVHGPVNGDTKLDGSNPAFPGIGRLLTAWGFPAIGYSIAYDAELVAREVTKSGYRKVGYVAPNQMYFGFGMKLKEILAGLAMSDATDLVDPIKAVKSAEEIALIRRTAALQDEVLVKTRSHIRPGMKEFEVTAYSQYIGQLLGSATGYFLAGSAPLGQPAPHRLRPQQGREIRDGDVIFWQAENTGPGGMFVHMGRFLVFGKAPQELVDVTGKMIEAQNFTVSMLKQGASCREAFIEYQAYMRGRDLPEEKRLHCHGQGYDVVERPLLREDETMPIAANMNIGIHPAFHNARMSLTICDNFLVGAGGVERLHKTPRGMIEL